jgi:hypothetical protein
VIGLRVSWLRPEDPVLHLALVPAASLEEARRVRSEARVSARESHRDPAEA